MHRDDDSRVNRCDALAVRVQQPLNRGGPEPMSTVAQSDTVALTVRSSRGRMFVLATLAYIAWNVVVSIIGLIVKLPDLPAAETHADRLTLGQVVADTGTIMSPPLALMILVGLLAWASTNSRAWVSRAATAATVLLVGLSVVAESTGFGEKPTTYSSGKWHLCIALGTVFDVLGVAVLLTGVLSAIASRSARGLNSSGVPAG
jgi:hypothetical protein